MFASKLDSSYDRERNLSSSSSGGNNAAAAMVAVGGPGTKSKWMKAFKGIKGGGKESSSQGQHQADVR